MYITAYFEFTFKSAPEYAKVCQRATMHESTPMMPKYTRVRKSIPEYVEVHQSRPKLPKKDQNATKVLKRTPKDIACTK